MKTKRAIPIYLSPSEIEGLEARALHLRCYRNALVRAIITRALAEPDAAVFIPYLPQSRGVR